jgi:hypothetical protein
MYLRGFSPWRYDKTSDKQQKNQIWVYFLKTKEIQLTSVHNVAARSHYYSFRNHDGSYNDVVEKLFSKIEGRAAESFRDLEIAIDKSNLHTYGQGIGENVRRNLVEFLFLHMIRVPANMDYIRQEMAQHEGDISKKHGKDYSEDYVQKNSLRVLTRIGRSKEMPIVDRLLKKDCRILSILPSRACFLTTDNPVIRFNATGPDGVFYTNTEVDFPVNQRALMMLHGDKSRVEIIRFKDVTAVFDFNCHMARGAKELIISSNKDYLVKVLDTIGADVVESGHMPQGCRKTLE